MLEYLCTIRVNDPGLAVIRGHEIVGKGSDPVVAKAVIKAVNDARSDGASLNLPSIALAAGRASSRGAPVADAEGHLVSILAIHSEG